MAADEIIRSLAALAQDRRLPKFRLLVQAVPHGLARVFSPKIAASRHLVQAFTSRNLGIPF